MGCETQMNCDDSWVPSCLFFFLRFVHIWLYIFLSPDLTHQYLYFLKRAPPWIIPLKDFFFLNNPQFLGILLSQLSFPQIYILKSFFTSHLRVSFENLQFSRSQCCSLLLHFSLLFKVSFHSFSSAGCSYRAHFFSTLLWLWVLPFILIIYIHFLL